MVLLLVDIMSNGPVDCVVKTPVSLQIGDTVTDTLRPGVYVTDIVFPNGKPIKVKQKSDQFYHLPTPRCLQQ